MSEEIMNSIKLANINGYLLAFGYTFECTEIEYNKDIITAFESNFKLNLDESLGDTQLIPIEDWKVKIEGICEEWFFQVGYPTPTSKYVSFQKQHCIEGFIKLLSDFFEGLESVHEVECDPNFFMKVYGMISFLHVTRECFFYILEFMTEHH
ncbi:hypothetical protein LJR153_001079 [Paenibacillus sp. LjRoot153]|uniref:hypothetical protein n=1 Tax=Paenibacillus sp. LjRoot153 TaxID=3342270 RepID=UPI003ECD1429